MQITREWLMDNRTPRGGWTKAQFKALGIAYPPRHGWVDAMVGRHITDGQVQAFIAGRGKFSSATIRRMTKAIRKGHMDPGEMDRLYGREPAPGLADDEAAAIRELREIARYG